MNIFDYEFDKNEVAIWETITAINNLDEIKGEVNEEFDQTRKSLKKLQEQLLDSTGWLKTER